MNNIVGNLLEALNSDDEEVLINIPHPVLNLDDDVDDVLQILQPVMDRVQIVEHVRVTNYIENVVRNYIHNDFVMHFRLSRDVAYELIARFSQTPMFLALQVHAGFEPITPEKHILCYLWFIGHETASYRDVSDRFGISLSTLFNIITRVTTFLLSIAPTVIRFPSEQERRQTQEFYRREKRFPGVVGSIDGSHVRIDKPLVDQDSYVNRKQYFSIQLQGVIDENKKFMDVFIGYPGSVHDARVFRESSLYDSLQELCGDGGYLLGDSAYPCLKHLIVPYRDNGRLTRAQRHFNQRLSSCRVAIENAFGLLKQRFRQLYHCKLRSIVRIVQVIHACCVLHNLANAGDMELLEPPMNDDYPDVEVNNVFIEDINVLPQDNQAGRDLRDELCRQIDTQMN